MSIISKLPHVGTTIFSVMSQLAQEHKAINLSQGFPDFDIDPALLEKVNFYHQKGYHQYAPMPGILSLRQEIVKIYQNLYQSYYNTDTEIIITNGASEAIFCSIASLIHQGDEAIIFEPAYDLYSPAISLFGGTTIPITTYAPNFAIDWDTVERSISPKTKLIIINNPNNPTGKMWTYDDFVALEKLVVKHQLLVIADEVYAHIIIGEQKFYSVAQFPHLKANSIITASFGKLLHTTGWKVGYCLAPAYLMTEIKKVHQFNVFTVNHALQHAICDYIQDATVYLELSKLFKPKYQLLANGLTALGFHVLPTEGTYFLTVDYSGISTQKDADFATLLTQRYQVATIPISAFYLQQHDDKLLRFCFAKKDETLQQALHNLQDVKQYKDVIQL
jgi:methionine aminotransferase